ncbi:MAG: ribosome recycling factor [Flavobacteriales bacterium]
MHEEAEFAYETAKESMDGAIKHLKDRLSRIRTGKADPNMLDHILVEYYGAQTPLNQLANVNIPDGSTITIQPFEQGMIQAIEKAIQDADLGLNPQNNGERVIINIPPLTDERRQQMTKTVRSESEDAKVSIRNARREANDSLKKLKKEGTISEDEEMEAENQVQKLTDSYTKKVDEFVSAKEEDLRSF